MAKFNIGDIICKDEASIPYIVAEIDSITGTMPKYKLVQGNFSFWDYCIGWKKLATPDEALRYGEVLTDDKVYCEVVGADWFSDCEYARIRTISYDNRIFYHKMMNGEVVEFKELTV